MSRLIHCYGEGYCAECPFAECPFAECPFAECPFAECHYAERQGAHLIPILETILLIVMAPKYFMLVRCQ